MIPEHRCHYLFLVALILPTSLYAGASKVTFLSGTAQTCRARLPSGQQYEIQRRILRWRKEKDVFIDAVAYYAPGSGEFLWRGQAYTNVDQEYLNNLKESGKLSCTGRTDHNLQLRDHEWTDFEGLSANIQVFHSTLRFPSIKKGWQYVLEHPDETADSLGLGPGKWLEVISIYNDIGAHFFRPEKLRFDARPYTYDSLVSATKVGSGWEVEIKGADEPARALLILDSNFKLVKLTRIAAGK